LIVRTRELFAPTLRSVSGDVEMASHRLLLRAGFIRQLAAGIYCLLPLGWRVVHKIEDIVREEMDAAGAQELFLPTLHPLELWDKSGRTAYWGPELIRLQDRNGRNFCLGGTHEEVITQLVGSAVRSYRELPFTLYQIQVKFRDEVRPRGGLVRAREFTMKDAYSFDRDVAGLDRSYDAMVTAYHRIMSRIGIPYRVADASGAGIGGWDTREFVFPCEVGESSYLCCDACGYDAAPEAAEFGRVDLPEPTAALEPVQRVETPEQRTIEQVTSFLGVEAKRLVKTLIYKADGRVVGALVRGDRELSEDKLKIALGATKVAMADAGTIELASGAPVGFAGPIGLKEADIVADDELRGERNFVTGGNEVDLHLRNVNWDRDFEVSQWAQLRHGEAGDPCAQCGRPLQAYRGIELAHVFKLGTIYSETLEAYYLDEDGGRKPIVMGCYGLGSTRTMAALAEHCHDETGLVWPPSVAPFDVIVIVVNHDDGTQRALAERVYGELGAEGYSVLLEDRAERPGVKFKDADLIGVPGQVVVGRLAGEGKVEVRRRAGESATVPANEVCARVSEALSED
jgi:prolyl-tRNA synthetase